MHDNAHRLCEIALLAGLELGISLREGQKLLKEVSATSSLEIIAEQKGALYLLDASYTPTDTERALHAVREHTRGRLIVVIGCVGMRDNDRRAPIGRALDDYADRIYLTADDPGFEPVSSICAEILSDVTDASKFDVIPQREDALRATSAGARRGDTVLLIGKGYEPYQLIGSKRVPYSEREALLRILSQA
jgi:UDP-N-acetylmuramoyl-L-alanyl-D-glutamate--2,6-diaminopimelate ligase